MLLMLPAQYLPLHEILKLVTRSCTGIQDLCLLHRRDRSQFYRAAAAVAAACSACSHACAPIVLLEDGRF